MSFLPSFDTSLISSYTKTKNEYAILSTYVSPIDQEITEEVPNLCMVGWTNTFRNWGTKACKNLIEPKLTTLWGAGLSFSRCHADLLVPVDPYLDNVFDGEEFSRSLRFWTHGYDVYTPEKVMVMHDYKKHQSNPVVHSWGGKKENVKVGLQGEGEILIKKVMKDVEDRRSSIEVKGVERVNMLFKGNPLNPLISKLRLSRYGLGSARSLEDAEKWFGVNFVTHKMEENRCSNLIWRKYEGWREGDEGGIEEGLRRGIWGEEGGKRLRGEAFLKKRTNGEKEEEMNGYTNMNTNTNINYEVVGCGVMIFLMLGGLIWRRKKGKGVKATN